MVDGIDNLENPNNQRAEWSGNISTEYVLSKILEILYPGSIAISQRCLYLLCNRQLAIILRMYGLPFDVNPEQEHIRFILEPEKPPSDLVRAYFGDRSRASRVHSWRQVSPPQPLMTSI